MGNIFRLFAKESLSVTRASWVCKLLKNNAPGAYACQPAGSLLCVCKSKRQEPCNRLADPPEGEGSRSLCALLGTLMRHSCPNHPAGATHPVSCAASCGGAGRRRRANTLHLPKVWCGKDTNGSSQQAALPSGTARICSQLHAHVPGPCTCLRQRCDVTDNLKTVASFEYR